MILTSLWYPPSSSNYVKNTHFICCTTIPLRMYRLAGSSTALLSKRVLTSQRAMSTLRTSTCFFLFAYLELVHVTEIISFFSTIP